MTDNNKMGESSEETSKNRTCLIVFLRLAALVSIAYLLYDNYDSVLRTLFGTWLFVIPIMVDFLLVFLKSRKSTASYTGNYNRPYNEKRQIIQPDLLLSSGLFCFCVCRMRRP